ncbi:hypothetical protein [Actinomadura meridiana]|uniref:hypothetical protein n=1 Tax=Actinomadura meridiana TaxID=559626 RepID=UPI0031EA7A2D
MLIDFVYEDARSITRSLLASFGASATAIGVMIGVGVAAQRRRAFGYGLLDTGMSADPGSGRSHHGPCWRRFARPMSRPTRRPIKAVQHHVGERRTW